MYWVERIAEAEQPDPEVIRSNTFVVTALQAAWWAIWSTKEQEGSAHLQAALRAAVGIGNDTDTVAAIAGALRAPATARSHSLHLAPSPAGMASRYASCRSGRPRCPSRPWR